MCQQNYKFSSYLLCDIMCKEELIPIRKFVRSERLYVGKNAQIKHFLTNMFWKRLISVTKYQIIMSLVDIKFH